MFKRMFTNIKSNGTVNINGKTYNANNSNISIQGNKVYIDGKLAQDCREDLDKEINITINGDCGSIECHGTLHVEGNVRGKVESENSITVGGDIIGDIERGNSATITGNVDGKIEAGNSVTVKGFHTGGKIDAGNTVRVGYK